MNDVDERTERLINRYLDGELTPTEQDELNQILLRSAEARRMLSDYQENDRLATETIAVAVEGRWSGGSVGPWSVARRWIAGRTVWAGVAAAAVLALVVLAPWQAHELAQNPKPIAPVVSSNGSVVSGDRLTYTSTGVPVRGERNIKRDYIGVIDEENDSLYVFEVDRRRTIHVPVAGDL